MIPKVASCIHAVRNDVHNAHILDGRIAHVLLLEIFTDSGIGTMIRGRDSSDTDAIDTGTIDTGTIGTDRGTSDMSAHTFDTAGMQQCPFMPVFGAPAISIERGAGTEVWDTDGRRYLDFLSGIAVTSLGHANPVVAEAICRQAGTLLHVSNFFTNPPATAAAVKVNELLHEATGHAGQIFFTNSGAEANECGAQARPQVRRTRPPHGGQRARQLPRTHARDARRHRPARQARAVRADARRVPARGLG
jgi:hypothetical protein